MCSILSKALTFLGMALALFGWWILASGWSQIAVLIVAIVFVCCFLLLVCSLKFSNRWLNQTVEILKNLNLSYLVLFLGFASLGISLLQKGMATAGVVILYIAFIILALYIGIQLGDAIIKWRRRNP